MKSRKKNSRMHILTSAWPCERSLLSGHTYPLTFVTQTRRLACAFVLGINPPASPGHKRIHNEKKLGTYLNENLSFTQALADRKQTSGLPYWRHGLTVIDSLQPSTHPQQERRSHCRPTATSSRQRLGSGCVFEWRHLHLPVIIISELKRGNRVWSYASRKGTQLGC